MKTVTSQVTTEIITVSEAISRVTNHMGMLCYTTMGGELARLMQDAPRNVWGFCYFNRTDLADLKFSARTAQAAVTLAFQNGRQLVLFNSIEDVVKNYHRCTSR